MLNDKIAYKISMKIVNHTLISYFKGDLHHNGT